MPFEKNNPYAKMGGRPGYELEQKQLETMRDLVSRDLSLVKKFYDGKANDTDFKKLQVLQVRISKYLDKLHASKQATEHSGEINIPIPIIPLNNVIHTNNSNKQNTEPVKED